MSNLIQPSHIIPGLAAGTRRDALAEMVRLVTGFDQEQVLTALREREAIGSSAIDPGLAVPHARVTGTGQLEVCFARSAAGIQWAAPDRQPVHLIFLMVASRGGGDEYLETLANLCRFLRDSSNRTLLMKASTEELVTFLTTARELQ